MKQQEMRLRVSREPLQREYDRASELVKQANVRLETAELEGVEMRRENRERWNEESSRRNVALSDYELVKGTSDRLATAHDYQTARVNALHPKLYHGAKQTPIMHHQSDTAT